MDTLVPVTIIAGFLGSGKTTLINHLLTEVGGKQRLAIVKNEIGDVSVDSRIIRGKNIVMKELLNGCVCCTLVGGLEESLKELVETVKPERIIVEASGAANPAILAVNIDRFGFVKRDLIVVVIDVVNFEGYRDKTMVGRLQHKFTDLVVLNRVGEVSEEVIDRVLDDVYEFRPGIPVIRSETGRVDPQILFGFTGKSTEITLTDDEIKHSHHHLEQDRIEVFSFRQDRPLDTSCVERVLNSLSENYLRVKGFVWCNDGSYYLVNFVCGRWEMERVEDMGSTERSGVVSAEPSKTELAFIGIGIGTGKRVIEERLNACSAS